MEGEVNFDPYHIPQEVTTQCKSCIFLLGLNPHSNASHFPVWTALTHQPKSPDYSPVNYSLAAIDTLSLPEEKQKRQSYEWYTPKGVLKSNWLTKYQQKIPSVFVLFYELEWTESAWTEKLKVLVEQVSKVKSAIGNRSCRIVVVLLQSYTASGNVPDSSSTNALDDRSTGAFRERASTLCADCGVPDKHLFVLPLGDTNMLPGYCSRLNIALSEISSGFYLSFIKCVRAHRDFLNKNNHQLLFVRHSFKIGLLSEFRNDMPSASKAYQQSYQYLSELRYTDTNLHELRISAAIINYKVCRSNFLLNQPRDAISQFRAHIELFRPRMGPKQLLFEHYAWLSVQYELFGALFEQAVVQGLPAVQTQHPGFYYQQAAQFGAQRRNTAHHLCTSATNEHLHLLGNWGNMEIYGQRPWRGGKHSLEPPESDREAKGVEAIQYRELHSVSHCDSIISLYTRAISQFQRYKCPRIKNQLMVGMATEYHKARNFSQAKSVLQLVCSQYRSENWWSLVGASSELSLDCAYLTADLSGYMAVALEMLSCQIKLGEEVKRRVYEEGIENVLKGLPPVSKHEKAASSDLTDLWAKALTERVTVDLTGVSCCLQMSASFCQKSCAAYDQCDVTVHCRNSSSFPLSIGGVQVTVSGGSDPASLPCDEQPLTLQSGGTTILRTRFTPPPLREENNTYKINGISCSLLPSVNSPSLINLTYPGTTTGAPKVQTEFISPTPQATPITELSVVSRVPKVEVSLDYDANALVWEWLQVKVNIASKEESAISALTLGMGLSPPSSQALEQTTQLSSCVESCSASDVTTSNALEGILVGDLAPGASVSKVIYVKALTQTKRNFTLKVNYSTVIEVESCEVTCPCSLTKTLSVVAKIPLQVDIGSESLSFSPISSVTAGEDFLLIPKLKCLSHVPITITQSKLLPSSSVILHPSPLNCVSAMTLSASEEADDCHCVSVSTSQPASDKLVLGHYLLHWKRSDSNSPPVSMSVSLPSVRVDSCSVMVTLSSPSHSRLYTPTPLTYTLTNHTPLSVECGVSVEQSQACVFTGIQQCKLRILSNHSESLTYLIYPTACGMITLPRVTVTVESASKQRVAALMRGNTTLLVKPQEKTEENVAVNFSHTVKAV